ncbi:hypothetical protein FQA39_LY11213 [Lamprigera yunnana]|nr:hypothetical protein FQA39_LY11213 [Lamprigera yunnana]
MKINKNETIGFTSSFILNNYKYVGLLLRQVTSKYTKMSEMEKIEKMFEKIDVNVKLINSRLEEEETESNIKAKISTILQKMNVNIDTNIDIEQTKRIGIYAKHLRFNKLIVNGEAYKVKAIIRSGEVEENVVNDNSLKRTITERSPDGSSLDEQL